MAYDASKDGQLQPTKGGTPASTFHHWAMFAGWQKWKPTYRYGTISAIDYDADTCSVTLLATTSAAKWANVNQSATLIGVPIEYMACNAGAFAVGDQVVVKFTDQDWTKPKVIGFRTNPKPCSAPVYCVWFEKSDWTNHVKCYFTRDDDGTKNWITEAEALNRCSTLADVWSSTIDPYDGLLDFDLSYGNGGEWGAFEGMRHAVVNLPSGGKLSVGTNQAGFFAWTKDNSVCLMDIFFRETSYPDLPAAWLVRGHFPAPGHPEIIYAACYMSQSSDKLDAPQFITALYPDWPKFRYLDITTGLESTIDFEVFTAPMGGGSVSVGPSENLYYCADNPNPEVDGYCFHCPPMAETRYSATDPVTWQSPVFPGCRWREFSPDPWYRSPYLGPFCSGMGGGAFIQF